MSSEYSYDEQGQFFPFFILTLSGLVTLPLTYTLLCPSKDPAEQAPRTKTSFKPENADIVQSLRSAQKRSQRRIIRTLFVTVGWALMAGMVYLIVVTKRTNPKLWNPYDILGISDSATEKVIKKTYKRLSLKFHPDKIKPDPAKNETMEELNARYVEISKAYQALTDEDVRNNFIQFGHPDGKQSFSYGIALPQFLVTGGNGKWVILIYAILLGVLLPYLVGSWWYGSQRMSKEKVLMESANNMFKEYEDSIDECGVVTALSTGKELEHMLKGDKAESGLSKIESRVLAEGKLSPFAGGMGVKDKAKLEDLDCGMRRKALALLWAYLGRVELDDHALNTAKFEVAPIAYALNNAFTAISMAYSNTGPILASLRTSQHLIQAVAPRSSPLLQLPHFGPEVIKVIEGDSKVHTSVQQFMDQSDAKRRSAAVGKGLLSEDQYKTAVGVAQQLPYFRVAKAFFKVTGEKYIIPGSLVSLVVKGRFVPPGSETVPEINPTDLEDVDPAEDDLDAILGRKRKKKVKMVDGKNVIVDDTPSMPPMAFSPYFARDHTPKWSVFLTDSKQGKMAVPPFTFTSFEAPIFTKDGKPTYAMQTLKAQFQAPPNAGRFTFVMHVVCDSYIGFDTKMEVTLHVDAASKATEMAAEEDDISEPEEDTIAGTMQALKSGGVPPPKRVAKSKVVVDDSSDESGTDDDEADTSDTNTDTEDES